MTTDSPIASPLVSIELRSTVKHTGELELALVEQSLAAPGDDEVIVRVDASPINPSDVGVLLAGADLRTAKASGTAARPIVTAQLSPAVLASMTARLDQAMRVGNEGAGVVVQTGASPAARALLGKPVAAVGGGMYAQYRKLVPAQCMVLPDGTAPIAGASAFINPLTALGMVETMRREGHTALVHTAAASNLGQMLVRICKADGVPLVTIVRKPEQVAILRELGAEHVCNQASPTFVDELTAALIATGATLAFDAIGGGKLASQILSAMEVAAAKKMTAYSVYGSPTLKQVYIYGALDRSPTELVRTFGMAWSIGGWLLTPFMMKTPPDRLAALKARIAAELHTTFASQYTTSLSLAGMLQLDAILAYAKAATGEKVVVTPNA